jgi:hypothetical protein
MIERDLMKKLNITPQHSNPEIQQEISAYKKVVEAINKNELKLREAQAAEEDTVELEDHIGLIKKVRDEAVIALEKKGVSTQDLKSSPVDVN